MPYKTIYLDEIDSTNNYAKTLSGAENTVIIAKRQTSGRGRVGKSFFSPEGGIYMSVILKGGNQPFCAGSYTALTAVAVADAIKRVCDIDCGIKWVNDIYIKNKKVCGILTEAVFDGNKLKNIIIGIGINVSDFLPNDELEEIATSIERESNRKIDNKQLINEILKKLYLELQNFDSSTFFEDYKKLSIVLGKEITVLDPKGFYKATAIRIEKDFSLTVLKDGVEKNINFGEISIKA